MINSKDSGNPPAMNLFKFLYRIQNNQLIADLLNNQNSALDFQDVSKIFSIIDENQLHDITRYIMIANILIKIVKNSLTHFDQVVIELYSPVRRTLFTGSRDPRHTEPPACVVYVSHPSWLRLQLILVRPAYRPSVWWASSPKVELTPHTCI